MLKKDELERVLEIVESHLDDICENTTFSSDDDAESFYYEKHELKKIINKIKNKLNNNKITIPEPDSLNDK